MINIDSVSKRFGNQDAVRDVSFTIQNGEIFGLIGPNGAGKTTTIRMIMNILAPDSGNILIDGTALREKDKERIGYLPEERGLYPKVKVGEVLLYLAELKGKEPERSQSRIDELLAYFDLSEWKDRKIEELSKGMSQKVQFIASIVHDPEVIIFDEPFSGLDPVSTDLVLRLIMELGEKGKTILFSTHLMEHAERICSSIFLINKGREVVQGKLDGIKERHGKRSVIIEYEGDGSFLHKLSGVKRVLQFPRYSELQLNEWTEPNMLLKEIVDKLTLSRFEVSYPSLHSIFISLIGNTAVSKGGPEATEGEDHNE